MTTTEAVRDRILHLCEERGLTINHLATICALPPSSIKNILYGKSQNPKLLTRRIFLHAGVRRTGAGTPITGKTPAVCHRQTAGVFIFTYRSRLRSPPAAPPCRSPSPRKTG